MDVHVYHPYKQPDGTNFCESLNGKCSHLCLPAPLITERSAKFSCACPNGMTLMKDMRTCIDKSISKPTNKTAVTTTTTTIVQTKVILPDTSIVISSTQTTAKIFQSTAVPPLNNASSSNYSSSNLKENTDSISESDTGKVAAIIIGVLGGLAIITTLVAFFMYKQYLRRNVTSMNFDNPVYRKTTEDQFSLEKNQYQPARSYPPSMEPLTSPGTNEFV